MVRVIGVTPSSVEEGAAIDHLQYLALLCACLLITLPLEFAFRARVYRRGPRCCARWFR